MPQHDGEASVEEILESIKKVIARDNRDSALVSHRRRAREGMADDESGEAAMEAAPEPVDAEEADEVLELGEAAMIEPVEDGDSVPTTGDSSGPADADEPLIAAAVRDSMRQNFDALSLLAEPGAAPQIVRSGETSLEGLVRDMLRPMLAEWLDANLPQMVERMVQGEIARIAGKGR